MEDGRLSEGVCCLLVLNSVAQPAPARVARRRSPTLLETCTQLAVCKRPLHRRAAAKMSQRIRIGPEPVLAAHAPSSPEAGIHRPGKDDSSPHSGTEFFYNLRGGHEWISARTDT